MIEFLPASTGNVIGMRFSGKLNRQTYRDVLGPRIDSLVGQYTSVRALILIDESFEGWSLSAAWANTILDLKHRRHFDKIAMVGAPKWEEWCVKVPAALLIRGQLKTFPRDQLEPAWDWLRA